MDYINKYTDYEGKKYCPHCNSYQNVNFNTYEGNSSHLLKSDIAYLTIATISGLFGREG